MDSRLRRSPPDRASAVPYGQAGENAMRFPRLAHRSAAAHKLHSTPQQDRMNLISGKGETSSRLPAFSLFSPEAVQTTGTVAIYHVLTNPVYAGAYVYGKSRRQITLDATGRRKRQIRKLPRSEWSVLIPEHHTGPEDRKDAVMPGAADQTSDCDGPGSLDSFRGGIS